MSIVFTILFFCLISYSLVLLWLAFGFLRTPFFSPSEKFLQTPVSIIICARNEEKNIIKCLKSILNQNYVLGRVQLILINDASGDATVQLAERVLKGSGLDYRIVSNPHQKGKKQSISYAMQFVKNELVILRDADTFTQSKEWLQSISNFYKEQNCDLIIAPVSITNNSGMLWAIQAIENNVLALLACGSAYFQKSFLCNGANLIFTKTIFHKVNGYSSHLHEQSGDDIFFLEDVKKSPGSKIVYLKSKDAIVYTYPAYTFKQLLLQKIRWASKFKSNTNSLNFFLAAFSFLVNAGWLFTFGYSFIHPYNSKPALCFLLLKLTIDILLLFLASRFIKNKVLLGFSLPAACVYPVYVCMIALASFFIKPKWKV